MSPHARAQVVRRVCALGPGRSWIGSRGFSTEPRAEAARESLKPLPPSQQPPRPPPPPAHSPRVDQRGPLDWRSFAIILGMGTAGLAYYASEKQRRMDDILNVKTVGKAAVGGPFQLLDKDGTTVTEKNLLGRWTLIYFGFTMCPDVCPDELTKVSEVLDVLKRHGKSIGPTPKADVSPFLISIDPERDSPKRTHEYAVGFHEAFTGLSGSLDQARVAAKAYRVYFSKDESPGDDYLVDHSIITYLMDPNGEFVDFYAKNVTASEMAARIEAKMLAWKP